MEDQFGPMDSTNNKNSEPASDDTMEVSTGDDDLLMGAIGIDLEKDNTPTRTEINVPAPVELEEAFGAAGIDTDNEKETGDLDPYQIGANVAGIVRQLISKKLDRLITVAVEQAVAKELRRLKDKTE